MAFTLQDLINAHTNPGAGEDGKAQPLNQFIEANDQNGEVNLDALIQEAATEFEALSTGDTLANMDALRALTAVVSGLTEARDTRKAAQDEQMAEVADLAKVIQSATQTEDAVAEDTVDAVTEDTAEPVAAVTDAGPAAETADTAVDAAPVAVAAALDVTDDGDEDDAPADGGKKAPPFGKKPVVAGGRPVNLAELRRDRKTQPREQKAQAGATIVAAAEVRGFAAGAELTQDELTRVLHSKAQSYRGFGAGVVAKHSAASIRPNFPAELVTSVASEDEAVLDYACDDRRLKGGSLVAAGGWASPSERSYDLVPGLQSATAGLLTVPEIQSRRGGIEYTRGIDFETVYGQDGIGEFQTEAQAEAGTTKLTYRIPKPSFVEVRAEAFYTQVAAGILQEKTYPEVSKDVVPKVLAGHAHNLNARSIADMVALSKVVPLQTHGPSATTALLNGIAFQIEDYRYRYLADPGLRLEVVLPQWAKEVIRADLALRETADGTPLQVSDAQINAFFTARNANVQWVMDWQDIRTGGTTFGGHTNGVPTTQAYPTTVKALVYAAGTFVRGRGDVISLDTIYDSRGLEKNDFLRLFLEEMYFMAWRAHHSRVVTLPTSVNGATAQRIVLDGQGAPATP
ncbi:major capsid protein [Tsukamurella sputi]|uniref:major capsid protein n=1 Tax=Tsukamurella sputi TaxID=2591848 RepID=UPI0013150BD0|nr:major capsid protein [Tsukamurella sputi]